MKTLNEEQIEFIKEEIQPLLHQWSPSSNQADYQCCFCFERPSINQGEIEHKEDCSGQKILKMLK